MKYFFAFFLCISLVLSSCKEEKDEVLPTISIIEPGNNTLFSVLDTVRIRAQINDNENIVQVLLQLEELGSGRKVGQTLSFSPNNVSYALDAFYIIEDSLLNSGDYYFRIQAYDGENTTSEFASIRLRGIPQRALSYYLLLDRTNDRAIYEVDLNGQSNLITEAGQSNQITFNSRSQLLWWADLGTQQLGALQVKESQMVPAFYPNGNSSPDPILDMLNVNDVNYVSTRNGFVQGFNGSIADVFTYQSQTGFKVDRIYPMGNRIIVRETDIQGQNQRFLYLFSNGLIDSQFSTNDDLIGFGIRSSREDGAFQFVKEGSEMQVREYDLSSGQSNFFLQKLNFDFEHLIQIREYEYIFYNDSRVVTYNLSTNFVRTLATGLSNASVVYNEADESVYVASGSNVSIYDYQQGAQISNYSATFPIVDLVIRYNK
jgi:hypothetical protein